MGPLLVVVPAIDRQLHDGIGQVVTHLHGQALGPKPRDEIFRVAVLPRQSRLDEAALGAR